MLSKTNGILDPEKIGAIVRLLSIRELSYYYRLLQQVRNEEKVTVVTAIDAPPYFVDELTRIFSGLDMTFVKDKSILAGLIVSFADFIYDASMKTVIARISKQYEVN